MKPKVKPKTRSTVIAHPVQPLPEGTVIKIVAPLVASQKKICTIADLYSGHTFAGDDEAVLAAIQRESQEMESEEE
jgi:hypothetical protein